MYGKQGFPPLQELWDAVIQGTMKTWAFLSFAIPSPCLTTSEYGSEEKKALTERAAKFLKRLRLKNSLQFASYYSVVISVFADLSCICQSNHVKTVSRDPLMPFLYHKLFPPAFNKNMRKS